MKYYVIADPHSFYDEMIKALEEKGYFDDPNPHKLIICGDLFDRGRQSEEIQKFVSDLIDKDEVILIKGNHEDMAQDLADKFERYAEKGLFWSVHYQNGTVHTFSDLTGMDFAEMESKPKLCVSKIRETDYFKKIIPVMKNYFETEHFVFVHGWIPCKAIGAYGDPQAFSYQSDWREQSDASWQNARWYNGMLAASCGVTEEGKTIVCGHWHTSYGHSVIEKKGEQFGETADFSPYYGNGIIALDACTAYSRKVNCMVISDTPVQRSY